MPQIISFLAQKGGVGKTSSCTSFAYFLADQHDKKVLCIDLDSQANLSQIFNAEIETDSNGQQLENGVFSLLMGSADFDDVVKEVETEKGLIHVIPSSSKLMLAGIELGVSYGVKGSIDRLKLALINHLNSYDFVLIDCPPNLSIVVQNALSISHYCLIPLQLEPLAINGINTMLEAVEVVRNGGVNKRLQIGGFMVCRYDKRAILVRDILADMEEEFGEMVFKTKIRQNVAIAESQAMRESIFTYAPDSNGAQDYKALFEEITTQLNLL